jgi:all-trans-retinol 13,14-reductase
MQDKNDVVIAGSGLGALVCAYVLAKNNYRVLVLEKNAQIGGCLQTFTRGGVKFDTGMHYIGSMEEGQILNRFFGYLGLLDDVKLKRLDNDGYDVISIDGQVFKYASGFKNFVKTLSDSFPENAADIEKYAKRIKEIADASPLYKLSETNTNDYVEADYNKTSVNEFIESITGNQLLQSVLAGNLPLYAGVKNKTPVYIHALINNFYIQSAWRIVGGSDAIARSLAKSIENFGGKIITGAEVAEFVCDDKKVTKVHLNDGREYSGDWFISNIHPQITMDKVKSKLIRKVYRERIAAIDNTIPNFTVFIKFKKNQLKYQNYNFYYYDNQDVWSFNDYDAKRWPQSYLYMHQCENENAEYARSAQIIACMRFDEVRQWENTCVGRRGEDYEEFKRQKAEKLIDKLESAFAGTRNAIESYYTSTPLTYRDYTATKDGSMYGIVRDKNSPAESQVSHRTKIPNLLMTGQNINSHGILGVIIGAIITCADFLGMDKILEDING